MGAFFGVFFSWLFGWFARALPWIAGFFGTTAAQVLISAGWGVTSFIGFDFVIGYFLEVAVTSLAGLPSDALQLLGLMWVDKAFNMMLSTATALLVLKGVRNGAMSRTVWHKPGSKTGGFEA
ncbi:membrane hypothetical protein [Vibrio nigripulchritudo FTn2]|uniref:DUF2523 family protein n=1 Tax=Vibrio nigripulchritudo TaxID=28173 RepID=UPI0003B22F11|nr:DUF2523 family protein [Vibrio nigripulchritudo]CCN40358.1 membrane hypothetical protein [Vibrio nigripulchritudo FTn2]